MAVNRALQTKIVIRSALSAEQALQDGPVWKDGDNTQSFAASSQ